MSVAYQHPTRTPAEMAARVSAGTLVPKQLYVVQDGGEYVIAQALTANTYTVVGRGKSVPDPALVAAIRAGSGTGYLSPPEAWEAMAPVALTDAATIALDLAAGVNFIVTLGGNRTLGNPSNAKPGQQGCITVSRAALQTLSFGSNWRGFDSIDLPTSSGKGFKVVYEVISAARIDFRIAVEL